jgi:isorenieratene synthase
MWRSPTVGLADLRAMDGPEAREMMRFDPHRTYERLDGQSATEYLDRLRMPPAARRMLFEVFARSFFDPEGEMSAAELVMRFHLYFMGSSEGLVFDVVTEPFPDSIWAPMARHLDALGVDIRLGVAAESLDPPSSDDGGRWRVHTGGAPVEADAVVAAVPVGGLQEIVTASPGLADPAWRESVAALRQARPFTVWRLWLDRAVDAGRPVFAGTAGLGPLDNVSLLDRYEGESRRWSLRTGGSVVELHAYALPARLAADEGELKAELRAALSRLYPETAAASVLEDRYLLRDDAPAFPPGSHATRPTVETPVPGLALAGDFVRLEFPSALMERAVASGMLAANSVLREWGVAPEPVWSGRSRGLLAWVRSPRWR